MNFYVINAFESKNLRQLIYPSIEGQPESQKPKVIQSLQLQKKETDWKHQNFYANSIKRDQE